jgi:hypothetical protein
MLDYAWCRRLADAGWPLRTHVWQRGDRGYFPDGTPFTVIGEGPPDGLWCPDLATLVMWAFGTVPGWLEHALDGWWAGADPWRRVGPEATPEAAVARWLCTMPPPGEGLS